MKTFKQFITEMSDAEFHNEMIMKAVRKAGYTARMGDYFVNVTMLPDLVAILHFDEDTLHWDIIFSGVEMRYSVSDLEFDEVVPGLDEVKEKYRNKIQESKKQLPLIAILIWQRLTAGDKIRSTVPVMKGKITAIFGDELHVELDDYSKTWVALDNAEDDNILDLVKDGPGRWTLEVRPGKKFNL